MIALDVVGGEARTCQVFGAETVPSVAGDPVRTKDLTRGDESSPLGAELRRGRDGRSAQRQDLGTPLSREGGDVTINVSQDLLRRKVTLIGSDLSSVGQGNAGINRRRRIPLKN